MILRRRSTTAKPTSGEECPPAEDDTNYHHPNCINDHHHPLIDCAWCRCASEEDDIDTISSNNKNITNCDCNYCLMHPSSRMMTCPIPSLEDTDRVIGEQICSRTPKLMLDKPEDDSLKWEKGERESRLPSNLSWLSWLRRTRPSSSSSQEVGGGMEVPDEPRTRRRRQSPSESTFDDDDVTSIRKRESRMSSSSPPLKTYHHPHHHHHHHSFLSSLFLMVLTVSCTFLAVLVPVTDACSSRSTPKPRPPSPTMRPNITIQTYTCPPEYDAHYCLNGATCFTVKIGESILYNCECAEGYMGQRCEFKDLDGSYLPSKQRAMLEQAGVSSAVAIVIILVVIISAYAYVRRQSGRNKASARGRGDGVGGGDQVDNFAYERRRPFSQLYYNNPSLSLSQNLHHHHHHESSSHPPPPPQEEEEEAEGPCSLPVQHSSSTTMVSFLPYNNRTTATNLPPEVDEGSSSPPWPLPLPSTTSSYFMAGDQHQHHRHYYNHTSLSPPPPPSTHKEAASSSPSPSSQSNNNNSSSSSNNKQQHINRKSRQQQQQET